MKNSFNYYEVLAQNIQVTNLHLYAIQVLPHVAYIVQFITTIAQDNERSDGSIAASAGLIG